MTLASALLLPVRIGQAVLAVIILGLTGHVANNWWSISEVNFLIFNSVWTLLAVAYLVLAPTIYPAAAHKYIIAGVEFLTMLFWFAGFIALAVLLTNIGCTGRRGGLCGESIASTVFAAFEWVLFSGTMIVAALHCWNTRGSSGAAKQNHPLEVQAAPYQGA